MSKHFIEARGFTLVELIVVMAVFVVIIGIAGYSFNTLITQGGLQAKSSAANAEALVGIELMRKDLSHAGFGVPWSYPVTLTNYSEVNSPSSITNAPAGLSESASSAPHAIMSKPCTTEVSGAGGPGPNYLVIRSCLADPVDTTKKWSYSNYSTPFGKQIIRTMGTTDDLQSGDPIIVLKLTFSKDTGGADKMLATTSGGAFYTTATSTSGGPLKFSNASDFAPQTSLDNFLVYKIGATSTTPQRPFARTDYYVKPYGAGQAPDRCAPNTGILTKAVLRPQDTSASTEYPVIDCVADMQVLYDMGGGSFTSDITTVSAADLRKNLQEVQVYILTHEGGKDRNYTYPSSTITVGRGVGSGRIFNLPTIIGSGWQNYRWKVYLLSVKMENLY